MTAKAKKRRKAPIIIITAVVLVLLGMGIRLAVDYCNEQYLLATHPVKYSEYVSACAKEFDVPEMLVFAVIKTESGFREDAESSLGARGLMQIMEQTFDWLKFRQGDENASYSDMYDPETNIRYGCYLLGFLMDEFGCEETAAAAYHAGRGQVNEWLSDEAISSDGVHLDTIPIRDTAHYVHKVTKAKAVYVSLYG